MSGPGQDSAGSDCGNVNSWEFTCPLWEELDFPDRVKAWARRRRGTGAPLGCAGEELPACPLGDSAGELKTRNDVGFLFVCLLGL